MNAGIVAEIEKRMPLEEFKNTMTRLRELHGEEEQKLKALAELQQYYVGARSDQERDAVKKAVAEIREISRATRQEIRELNNKIVLFMTLAEANDFYNRLMAEG